MVTIFGSITLIEIIFGINFTWKDPRLKLSYYIPIYRTMLLCNLIFLGVKIRQFK